MCVVKKVELIPVFRFVFCSSLGWVSFGVVAGGSGRL